MSRWQAIGWRSPCLGVSHWLPHQPFAQEPWQSYYMTASSSSHTHTIPVHFTIISLYPVAMWMLAHEMASHDGRHVKLFVSKWMSCRYFPFFITIFTPFTSISERLHRALPLIIHSLTLFILLSWAALSWWPFGRTYPFSFLYVKELSCILNTSVFVLPLRCKSLYYTYRYFYSFIVVSIFHFQYFGFPCNCYRLWAPMIPQICLRQIIRHCHCQNFETIVPTGLPILRGS